MSKTLSVVLASILSFGGTLPAMAGTTPINVGTSTSNSAVGSGERKTILLNISESLINSIVALGSRDSLTSSLKDSGISEQLLTDLFNTVFTLVPLDINGKPSIRQGSVSVDLDKFNAAIAAFNNLVDTVQDDEVKKGLLKDNQAFMAISNFLRSQRSN
jgi:hypothetical protein